MRTRSTIAVAGGGGVRHTAQGRLTLDELQERTAAAYAATTHPQLQALTQDLPGALVFGPAWPSGGSARFPPVDVVHPEDAPHRVGTLRFGDAAEPPDELAEGTELAAGGAEGQGDQSGDGGQGQEPDHENIQSPGHVYAITGPWGTERR
ncbi:MAG TPA: DUF1707 domain-containing protein [Actinomycetota bacterium]|nr:DUF1707 domain-containing protein [Actinomycetota bacterium]